MRAPCGGDAIGAPSRGSGPRSCWANGSDFEVVTPDLTYLFEVKATTGGDTQFSLQESEVRREQALDSH